MRGLLLAASAVLLAAGCSSSSSRPAAPKIGAAATYHLAGFEPTAPARPGKPAVVSFTIDQPSGAALVDYKRGSGPHTGIHMIVVREDLSVIIHRHPKVGPNGAVRQPIVFPKPGSYRVLVDAYPNLSGPLRNFQLTENVRVAGAYRPQPLPPPTSIDRVGGYTVTLHGAGHLKAIDPIYVTATVVDAAGRPVKFVPWYGALAHAIFFRKGSLDYFHTHVCSPNATGCTSILGGTRAVGRSSKPGRLNVVVLVPLPGTWRLFLQFQANGKVLTAPFTLHVR
jgi:hypothetical protein